MASRIGKIDGRLAFAELAATTCFEQAPGFLRSTIRESRVSIPALLRGVSFWLLHFLHLRRGLYPCEWLRLVL